MTQRRPQESDVAKKLAGETTKQGRMAWRSSYDTSASILLNSLNWDNLSTRRKKLKATLMFKIIKGLSRRTCRIYLASVVHRKTEEILRLS